MRFHEGEPGSDHGIMINPFIGFWNPGFYFVKGHGQTPDLFQRLIYEKRSENLYLANHPVNFYRVTESTEGCY
jgi:hypothetical protein